MSAIEQELASDEVIIPDEAPPDVPVVSPLLWMRENLASSWRSALVTVVMAAITLGVLWFLLDLIFAEEAQWDSVTTNLRLLLTYNYPVEQYSRIWVAVGTMIVAGSFSMGIWGFSPPLSLRRLGINIAGAGSLSLVLGVLMTWTEAASASQVLVLAVGAVLVAVGVAVLLVVPNPHERHLRFTTVFVGAATTIVLILWLVPFGRHEFANGEVQPVQSGTINISTKLPWSVILVLAVVALFVGRAPASRAITRAMVGFWVLGPAFLLFLVLRDPAFDYSYVFAVDVPIALAFAILGGGLLYFLAIPGRTEIARGVASVLLGLAALNWVAGFAGWWPMLQKVRISFFLLAVFAFAAVTFAGEHRVRMRFVGMWVGVIAVLHWLITAINTPSTLQIVAPPFIGGLTAAFSIAYYVMLASFPIGILMALARTSKMPLFRIMATTYIEFVRGIPLITVLFFFSVMINLFLPAGMEVSELAAVFIGYTLFSGAYMAENIRGGLQSVRQGQYEASDALGLTTLQRTMFIVLPQALRVSIPNLVGQAIATFKETSLLAIVGIFDLLRIANATIPNQPDFIGQNRPALLLACAIYWIFTYPMSRASRGLEQKLGVGVR